MTSLAGELGHVARLTFRRPAEAAELLRGMAVPRDALWTAFWLVCVLATLFEWAMSVLLPLAPEGTALPAPAPFVMLIETLFANGLVIFAMWRGGQMWDGEGSLEQTATMMIFLQGLGVAILSLFLLLFVAVPILAQLAILVIAVWALWVNLTFIKVLHRFASVWKALGLSIAIWIGVLLFQIFLVTLLGGPPGV